MTGLLLRMQGVREWASCPKKRLNPDCFQVARDLYEGGAGNLNEYANALKLLNNFLTHGTTAMVTKWIDDEREIEEEMRD